MAEPAPTKPDEDGEVEETGRQMTFAEHLDELRGHVMRCVIVLVLLTTVTMVFQDYIAKWVLWPYVETQSRLIEAGTIEKISPLKFLDPVEGWLFFFKIALYGAAIAAMPYALYEMWRFISAGLYKHERRAVMKVLPVSFALFVTGVAFAYLILIPIALNFLLAYTGGSEYIEADIRLESYLGFFLMMCLVLGFVFQLPLIQVVLARFDIISARTQAKRRRAFIMTAVVAAAVVTPTGDAVTLSLVAVPMLALFELGLLVAYRVTPVERKDSDT